MLSTRRSRVCGVLTRDPQVEASASGAETVTLWVGRVKTVLRGRSVRFAKLLRPGDRVEVAGSYDSSSVFGAFIGDDLVWA